MTIFFKIEREAFISPGTIIEYVHNQMVDAA